MFKSAKKKKGMIVGFVTFESAEQVKIAVEVNMRFIWKILSLKFITHILVSQGLDGKSIGNNRTLKVSDIIARPFENINKAALAPHSTQKIENPSLDGDLSNINNEAEEDGSLDSNGSVLKGRSARDVVTPLAHMSYSDQLEHKKNSLAQTLKKLVSKMIFTHYVCLLEGRVVKYSPFVQLFKSNLFCNVVILEFVVVVICRLAMRVKPVRMAFHFLNGL